MIVRLKGVKKVRSKGHTYYYHRKTMTRLPGVPGSSEFQKALGNSITSYARPAPVSTLGLIAAAYRSGPDFLALAPATRRGYNKVFDDLHGLADMPLAQITPEFLFALRDKKAEQHSRSTANHTIELLRAVFSWGVRRGHMKVNPALAIGSIRRPRNAPVKNRPWRPEELAAVLDAAPPWLRVAVALAAYTGLRSGDIVRASWSCYDGRAFETRAQKTGVPTWVPAHYRLREILDAAPRTAVTIVVGHKGRPFASRGALSPPFFALLKRLRAEGKVGPGLSFHGLRHTLGTALAEVGCDPRTIASVLGHTTLRMADHYSHTADRRALASAAIEKLERKDRG